MEIKVTQPGKLMLAGEWAVLEIGVPCIVMAIDKNVSVTLKPSEKIEVLAPDFGLGKKTAEFDSKTHQLNWQPALTPEETEKLLIATHAISIALQYLSEKKIPLKNFHIATASEDCMVKLSGGTTKKIGFGSSAAACVGMVRAILEFHGLESKTQDGLERVFKLACIGHFNAQGKVGSGFDVAASTFGGMLLYKRFDPKWLEDQKTAGKNISQIVDSDWPELQIESLQPPKNFELLIGYTGPDSSTKEMIKKVQACKAEQKERYWQVINEIRHCVEGVLAGIKTGDRAKIIEELQRNRNALVGLSEVSGIELETEKLAELANSCEDLGAAGKLSGSGGGGLGIGVCFDTATRKEIEKTWKENGIERIYAGIAPPTTPK